MASVLTTEKENNEELTVSHWVPYQVDLGVVLVLLGVLVENVDHLLERGALGTRFQVQSQDPVEPLGSQVYQRGDQEDLHQPLQPSWLLMQQRLQLLLQMLELWQA